LRQGWIRNPTLSSSVPDVSVSCGRGGAENGVNHSSASSEYDGSREKFPVRPFPSGFTPLGQYGAGLRKPGPPPGWCSCLGEQTAPSWPFTPYPLPPLRALAESRGCTDSVVRRRDCRCAPAYCSGCSHLGTPRGGQTACSIFPGAWSRRAGLNVDRCPAAVMCSEGRHVLQMALLPHFCRIGEVLPSES